MERQGIALAVPLTILCRCVNRRRVHSYRITNGSVVSLLQIKLKRAYEAPSNDDGLRILVERLWPRGLSKTDAAIDHWMKDIAPTPKLRTWFGHRPERWPQFRARYLAELGANAEVVRALEKLCSEGPVTFVFAARDTERNSAVVLKTYLEADRADAF